MVGLAHVSRLSVRHFFFSAGVMLLAACGGETSVGNDSDDLIVGPCVHIYEEPVISIVAATSTGAGSEPIAMLTLSSISINGVPVDEAVLAGLSEPSDNISVVADTLLCDVPCGAGTQEGLWSFDVSAEGYQTKPVQVNAGYSVFSGGCPSSSDVGTILEIEIDPAT